MVGIINGLSYEEKKRPSVAGSVQNVVLYSLIHRYALDEVALGKWDALSSKCCIVGGLVVGSTNRDAPSIDGPDFW